MKLIVITPEQTASNETSVVNKLFENGLQRLHLRKPSFTAGELRRYMGEIAHEYHQYVVLTSHFHLFDELKTGGIHLSSFARNDENIIIQAKHIPAGMVSTSFHSWEEIADNRYRYGYVFISPVFDSVSKPGYKAGIDLGGARSLKKQLAANGGYCPQLIALGGVTEGNLGTLHKYRFDGAAMLGNIWQASDPAGEFRKAAETAASFTVD